MKTAAKQPAEYADVRRVGIPRALLWWRYGVLWQTFFEELGREVVVDDPSDADTLARGDALSVDECCLASKLYIGHAENLLESGDCDALFVPSYANVGRFHGFCTKFQALPDLVASTFSERRPRPRILSCLIEEQQTHTDERDAFLALGASLGEPPAKCAKAWRAAKRAQKRAWDAAAKAQELVLTEASSELDANRPLRILLAAHPYAAHDPMIGGQIADMLRGFGVVVLFADEHDHAASLSASFDFSETMPWIVNREIVGAISLLRGRVDGIVIVSAFPCGPDSMTNDAVALHMKGTPTLTLTVDAQSGSAGLETRIESFVDILKYRREGGYLHGKAAR